MTPPTLSVLMLTSGSAPARTRGILELLRPVADEIVLTVDHRAGAAVHEACADLCDQRHELELAGSPDSAPAWSQARCRGDWVLLIDDDEVPSRRLLDTLPELLRTPRATAIGLERRWLWPDDGHYLTDVPWRMEFLPRLRRNVPGIWSFGGVIHGTGQVAGEQVLADAPLYHLDLVVNARAARAGKALGYEQQRPGEVLEGHPMNSLYVPEWRSGLDPVAVPPADLAVLAHVRDAQVPVAVEPPPAVERVPAAVLAGLSIELPVSDAGRRGGLEVVDAPASVRPAVHQRVLLEVANQGDALWPAGDRAERPIRIGYRWTDAAGAVVVDGRQLLPTAVHPGETQRVLAWVMTPPAPGPHTLTCELVHEGVAWFGTVATAAIEVEVPGPLVDPSVWSGPAPD